MEREIKTLDKNQTEKTMTNMYLNPATMPPPHGYSQVVCTEGNTKTVFISGQVAAGVDGEVKSSTIEEQADLVFKNIRNGLEAVGGRMEHLVKLNSYLKDITQISVLRMVRDQYVNTANPPASTTVQTVFDDPEILVEIDAIAMFSL